MTKVGGFVYCESWWRKTAPSAFFHSTPRALPARSPVYLWTTEEQRGLAAWSRAVGLYPAPNRYLRINISRGGKINFSSWFYAQLVLCFWAWGQSIRSEGAQQPTSWRSETGETAKDRPEVWASSSHLCSIVVLVPLMFMVGLLCSIAILCSSHLWICSHRHTLKCASLI